MPQRPLIAFKHDQPTHYPINSSILSEYLTFRATINKVELQKLQQRAAQLKPQTASQLAQEQLFELQQGDLPELFQPQHSDFIFGDEAFYIQPRDGYYIHQLFHAGGRMNFAFYDGHNSVTLYKFLLQKFVEHFAHAAIEKAIPIKHQDAQKPEQDVQQHYSSSIANLLSSKANPQLFDPKRILSATTYPSDLRQYIVVVVVPDDIDAIELQVYQGVMFDQLQFAGLQFIKQSQVHNLLAGHLGSVQLHIGLYSSKIVANTPYYPVLNGFQVNVPVCGLGVAQCFLQLLQNSGSELQALKRSFLCHINKPIKQIQLVDLKDLLPADVFEGYTQESEEVQRSVINGILFQINNNLVNLLTQKQRVFSLKVDENRQGIYQLVYPMHAQGYKLSFSLGYIGLATAMAINTCNCMSQYFVSRRFLGLNNFQTNCRDTICEQRDIQKTTKVQLTSGELVRPMYQNKELLEPINIILLQKSEPYQTKINQNCIKLDIQQIIQQYFTAFKMNLQQNENYLRQIGKQAENDDNFVDNFVSQLKENMVITGAVGNAIGHIQEELSSGQNFKFSSDDVINSYLSQHINISDEGKKITIAASILAATDGFVENCLTKEEYEYVGSRLWIEKEMITISKRRFTPNAPGISQFSAENSAIMSQGNFSAANTSNSVAVHCTSGCREILSTNYAAADPFRARKQFVPMPLPFFPESQPMDPRSLRPQKHKNLPQQRQLTELNSILPVMGPQKELQAEETLRRQLQRLRPAQVTTKDHSQPMKWDNKTAADITALFENQFAPLPSHPPPRAAVRELHHTDYGVLAPTASRQADEDVYIPLENAHNSTVPPAVGDGLEPTPLQRESVQRADNILHQLDSVASANQRCTTLRRRQTLTSSAETRGEGGTLDLSMVGHAKPPAIEQPARAPQNMARQDVDMLLSHFNI